MTRPRAKCIECGELLDMPIDDERIAICDSCMHGGTRALGCAFLGCIFVVIIIVGIVLFVPNTPIVP